MVFRKYYHQQGVSMEAGADFELEWFQATVDRQHELHVGGENRISSAELAEYISVAKCASNLSGWNAVQPPTLYAQSLIQALVYEINREEYLGGRNVKVALYRVVGTMLDFARGADGVVTITDKDGGDFDFLIDVSLREKQPSQRRKVISRREANQIVCFARNPKTQPVPRVVTSIRRAFANWFRDRAGLAIAQTNIIVTKNPPQTP